jgi:hypothetical protein
MKQVSTRMKPLSNSRQKYSQSALAALMVCYLLCNFILGCTSPGKKNVDVSGIQLNYQSIRYDKELYQCDTNNLVASIDQLGNKYPDFSSVFFTQLTGFKLNGDDSVFYNSVHHFLTYKDYLGLIDTVRKVFPNTHSIDRELQELFKHIQYYYPNQRYQTVYYFVSGLNYWKAITIDSVVGVGLDMFLGKSYSFYPARQIPDYETRRCEREFIPVFVAQTIYEKMFPIEQEGENLLELMLQNGRELLFMEYVLPDKKENQIIGYTEMQEKWCKENEALIWSFFSKKKLLFETDWHEIMRYVNDGPGTVGMPLDAPGNIGSWLGWQIVRTYWEENPSLSLQDILKETANAQRFLEKSKYKPRA